MPLSGETAEAVREHTKIRKNEKGIASETEWITTKTHTHTHAMITNSRGDGRQRNNNCSHLSRVLYVYAKRGSKNAVSVDDTEVMPTHQLHGCALITHPSQDQRG